METFTTQTNITIEEPQGWVASCIKQNPEIAKILNTHKIYNDVSYLNAEHCLDRITRKELAMFRLYHITGRNCTDPCAIARAAPPWLAKQRLASLKTSANIHKTLRENNLQTVADLATWTIEKFRKQTPFGFKTLYNISICLYETLDEAPAPDVEQTHNADIHDNIDNDLIANAKTKTNKLEQSLEILNYANSCRDPCKLARLALPWLGEWKLTDINIPGSAKRIFREHGIQTVSDLATCLPQRLLGIQGFGRRSLENILNYLNIALTGSLLSNLKSSAEIDAIPNSKVAKHLRLNLIENIRYFLLSLDPAESYIFKRHLGFETSPLTIREISEDNGKTYGYINQIRASMMKKLKNTFWRYIFIQKIARLLNDTNFKVSPDNIENIDPWFEGVHSYQIFFQNLIELMNQDDINIIRIGNISYISIIDQSDWQRIVKQATALLASSANKEWSETETCLQVRALLPDTAKQYADLLWNQVSGLCHYKVNPNGIRIFAEYGRGLAKMIKVILSESDLPMHHREIAKVLKLKLGLNLKSQQIRSAANTVSFFFARGVYGLDKHIPLSDEQITYIGRQAEHIVYSDKAKKQWHTHEILSSLSKRADEITNKLNVCLLNIILSKSNAFSYLGRMIWTTTKHGSNGEKRFNRTQVIAAIIKKAGHPLKTEEIKEQLQKIGGMSKNFYVSLRPPLVCIKSNLWGVSDRDIPLSKTEQNAFIEKLIDKLNEKQSVIDIQELQDIFSLQGYSPLLFFSIATQDKRLRCVRKRYIYLNMDH